MKLHNKPVALPVGQGRHASRVARRVGCGLRWKCQVHMMEGVRALPGNRWTAHGAAKGTGSK